MSNFWTRSITGTVFVVVLVGAILLGGIYLQIVFGLVVLFGLIEFYNLFRHTESSPNRILGVISGVSIYFLCFSYQYINPANWTKLLGAVLFLVFVVLGIAELFRRKTRPFENIALTVAGLVYVVLPFVLLIELGRTNAPANVQEESSWLILSIFILIWCNDTFAYLTGRLIGKHKLFERISPKKTWEGFIGGIVFAIVAGVLLSYFLEVSYVKFIVYAVVVGAIGTLGDLVESMLKRSVDVKDSGTILPGHGGILDRFDAVLFAVPVIFVLEVFIFA